MQIKKAITKQSDYYRQPISHEQRKRKWKQVMFSVYGFKYLILPEHLKALN